MLCFVNSLGGFGVDFSSACDNVSQRLEDVSTKLLQYGVTSFCPTLVTSSSTVYKEVIHHWMAIPITCNHITHSHSRDGDWVQCEVWRVYLLEAMCVRLCYPQWLLYCQVYINCVKVGTEFNAYVKWVHPCSRYGAHYVCYVCDVRCLLPISLTFHRFYPKFKWH